MSNKEREEQRTKNTAKRMMEYQKRYRMALSMKKQRGNQARKG